MRDRIGRLVGPRARAIWASTFHSACVRILRREAEEAGYRARLLDLRRRRPAAPDPARPGRGRGRPQAHLAQDGPGADLRRQEPPRGARRPARGVVPGRDRRPRLPPLPGRPARQRGDGLRRPADDHRRSCWSRTRRCASAGRPRFRHVLVDEYQDTNHAQYRLVRALGEPQRNVVAVGDDDQGIYSWRGADVRNILDFERDYPDARVVALEQNYRSTGVILRAANAVVSHNPHRHPKRLWTALGEGDPILADVVPRRARGGARRGLGDRPRPGPGPEPLRGRGLLPHQRPEPRDRGPARAPLGALRGGRRAALLRARRDPRPARLPAGGRQPGRRGQPGPHDGGAQARRGPGGDRQARGLRGGAGHPGGRGAAATPTRPRACRPAQRARDRRGRAPARRRARGGGGGDAPRPARSRTGARALGPARRAGARGHLRGPGPGREPRRDGARGRRVRGRPRRSPPSPGSWRAWRCRPTPTWSTSRPARSR